jgi:hypothetical protein
MQNVAAHDSRHLFQPPTLCRRVSALRDLYDRPLIELQNRALLAPTDSRTIRGGIQQMRSYLCLSKATEREELRYQARTTSEVIPDMANLRGPYNSPRLTIDVSQEEQTA